MSTRAILALEKYTYLSYHLNPIRVSFLDKRTIVKRIDKSYCQMFLNGGKIIASSIRILKTGNKLSLNKPNLIGYSLKGITTPCRTMSSGQEQLYTAQYLSDKIKKELSAEHVDVEDLSNCGCGMKFDAVIVSPQFEGKPILQRQRLVNQTLAEEMKHIHAFTMRTFTPTQWRENAVKKDAA